jgi:hypothetical protein
MPKRRKAEDDAKKQTKATVEKIVGKPLKQ